MHTFTYTKKSAKALLALCSRDTTRSPALAAPGLGVSAAGCPATVATDGHALAMRLEALAATPGDVAIPRDWTPTDRAAWDRAIKICPTAGRIVARITAHGPRLEVYSTEPEAVRATADDPADLPAAVAASILNTPATCDVDTYPQVAQVIPGLLERDGDEAPPPARHVGLSLALVARVFGAIADVKQPIDYAAVQWPTRPTDPFRVDVSAEVPHVDDRPWCAVIMPMRLR